MKIKPFKGLRPVPERVKAVASRPYDVMDSGEAREEAQGNPDSFLRVVKPEITLPVGIDPYSEQVYQAGRENFRGMCAQGLFIQEREASLYIYELTMDDLSQTGIVACAAVEDYLNGHIKRHELTRPDKEADRKNHVRISMLNAEPVFFAYRAERRLDEIVAKVKKDKPLYDFTADDGVQHRFWAISDEAIISNIIAIFDRMPATYVADGHHRTAAAALVGSDLKNANPDHCGDEAYNYFLAVHFPHNQLRILDYNRLVKDLNGLTVDGFIDAISERFTIAMVGKEACKPEQLHEMAMYLDGNWYKLIADPGSYDDSDPIGGLDVTILSEQVLKPLLNIHDLRTDRRIEFVGGSRGLEALRRRVDSGEMQVAFAMYPVSMGQLMDIADNGLVMPPKVTWFEPKLRSGVVVYSLEGGIG